MLIVTTVSSTGYHRGALWPLAQARAVAVPAVVLPIIGYSLVRCGYCCEYYCCYCVLFVCMVYCVSVCIV